MSHSSNYLEQTAQIATSIDPEALERLVSELVALRDRGGRLFLLGVGGSAANCSHAVNDFRKLTAIEAYSPSDNVAELTARTNDEGWETVFKSWLIGSRANDKDAIFVMSVGGGDLERRVSANIVQAVKEGIDRGIAVYGVVGRADGYTKRFGTEVIVVPTVDPDFITPHTESFQAVIWHAIVCHPRLMRGPNTWEGIEAHGEPG